MSETLQRYFDKTCKHLFRQGQQALGAVSCQYLTAGGLECAVGCHIPRHEYLPRFEILGSINQLVKAGILPTSIANDVKGEPELLRLLNWLQMAHDEPKNWQSYPPMNLTASQVMRHTLKTIAQDFGLNADAAHGWFAWDVTLC